ncbi:MAG: DUF1343 domain-containing protein, partial [Anaerolineales bacterium]|nr:DUF1343 domain-containing protein [Anaerolineales bacterium]
CLLEGINVSVGRGTALPFELCGAPWIDGADLAEKLNQLKLRGVRFRPLRFQPTASQYAGELCGGVQVHLTNRQAALPLRVGLELIGALRALYPQPFKWNARFFDLLCGSAETRAAIEAQQPARDIYAAWQAAAADFRCERERFLLYE